MPISGLRLIRLVMAMGMPLMTAAESFFFNGTDFTSLVANISSGCANALQGSLDCDPELRTVMVTDYWGSLGNQTLLDQFCRASCGTNLTNYVNNVKTSCSSDPEPVTGYPATYWGDWALSAWTQQCLKDQKTGDYCTVFIENLFAASANDSDPDGNQPTDPPEDQLCSNCIVNLFTHQQSTPYSNYDDSMASDWSSIQSKCGLSLPTTVPELQTNVTQPGGFAVPGSAKTGCLSGNTYNVASGDNCQAICEKNSCATATLITINDLYQDCSNLYAGSSLCLPASCSTYTVQSGDTCDKIANSSSVTFQQLIAWNPSLDTYCTSLIAGQNICISPPGGTPTLSTIAGATVTQTAIYATATATRPSSVASGTTRDCGSYYQVQYGDTCQLIALNQTIALGLFYAINPSINSDCTNLELGVSYCVQPTADWNSTASSTIASAPTTTPSGTTADCYEYYTIQSGDYCGKVEDMFAITMVQLQYWNPQLLSDCSNLALGEAYCVNGAEQPPSGGGVTSATATANANEKRDGHGSVVRMHLHHGPQKTPMPQAGGVPVGWPGLRAARLNSGAGLGHHEL